MPIPTLLLHYLQSVFMVPGSQMFKIPGSDSRIGYHEKGEIEKNSGCWILVKDKRFEKIGQLGICCRAGQLGSPGSATGQPGISLGSRETFPKNREEAFRLSDIRQLKFGIARKLEYLNVRASLVWSVFFDSVIAVCA